MLSIFRIHFSHSYGNYDAKINESRDNFCKNTNKLIFVVEYFLTNNFIYANANMQDKP